MGAENNEVRGEFCLIVEGSEFAEEVEADRWWDDYSIVEHVDHYVDHQKLSSKEAIKQTAKDRDMSKRDVYQAYHVN